MNGRARTLLFYLVDSIHAQYHFFVRPYPSSTTRKENSFISMQEEVRRDAERFCAVLTARFYIALRPAPMGTVLQLTTVAKAVAIWHEKKTVVRRGGYVSHRRSGYGVCAPGSGAPAAGQGAAEGDIVAAAGVGGPGGGEGAGFWPAAGLGGGDELPDLDSQAPVVISLAQSPHVRAILALREMRFARGHVALRDEQGEHEWAECGHLRAPYV